MSAREAAWTRIAVVLALLIVLGLGLPPGARGSDGETSGPFHDAEILLVPYAANVSVVIDGRVSPGEYSSYGAWADPSSGVAVDWIWDGRAVDVALSSPGPGWIALGFSPDLSRGMGFVVVARSNATYGATERYTANVSDEASLSPPASEAGVIESFNATTQGNGYTAELRMSANASLWDLQPGEVVPTIVAFNDTATQAPSSLAGSPVRFLRAYFLRPQDDPAELQRLFMKDISPVPGLIAVGSIGVGVATIVATFVRRKGAK